MNNYEKIKNMTIDEMAEWHNKLLAICVTYDCPAFEICDMQNCKESFKKWLEQEEQCQ